MAKREFESVYETMKLKAEEPTRAEREKNLSWKRDHLFFTFPSVCQSFTKLSDRKGEDSKRKSAVTHKVCTFPNEYTASTVHMIVPCAHSLLLLFQKSSY